MTNESATREQQEESLRKFLADLKRQEAADKRTETTGMEIPIIIGVFFGLGLLQNAVIWIIGAVGELMGWL